MNNSREICRIVVPWDIQLTSPNQRYSWRARARVNAKARETARLSWIHAGRPTSNTPVVIDVIIRRRIKVDDDNAWTALKPLRDGIFYKGLTEDDSTDWVRCGQIRQITGKEWTRSAEVEFVVREQ